MAAVRLVLAAALALLIVAACSSEEEASDVPTVGVVIQGEALVPQYEDFKEVMASRGYVEGETINYLFNGALETPEELATQSEVIVGENPDAVATWTTTSATKMAEVVEAQQSSIPHLFSAVTDPVGSGLVDSLEDPGDNRTGVGGSLAPGKALEWLQQAADVKKVLVPHDPNNGGSVSSLEIVQDAAKDLGVELVIVEASDAADLKKALAKAPKDVDGMFYLTSAFVSSNVDLLNSYADEHDLPIGNAASPLANNPDILVSYADTVRVRSDGLADLTIAVLEGAEAGRLPVAVPRAFLAVNLKVADKLGITVPESVVNQADTVMR